MWGGHKCCFVIKQLSKYEQIIQSESKGWHFQSYRDCENFADRSFAALIERYHFIDSNLQIHNSGRSRSGIHSLQTGCTECTGAQSRQPDLFQTMPCIDNGQSLALSFSLWNAFMNRRLNPLSSFKASLQQQTCKQCFSMFHNLVQYKKKMCAIAFSFWG